MMTFEASILIALVSISGVQHCEDMQTPAAMRECLNRELENSEQRLATTDTAILEGLDAAESQLYQRARTAWILFRDLQCDSEAAEYEGGTMSPVAELQCRVRLTEQRLDDLQVVYQRPG